MNSLKFDPFQASILLFILILLFRLLFTSPTSPIPWEEVHGLRLLSRLLLTIEIKVKCLLLLLLISVAYIQKVWLLLSLATYVKQISGLLCRLKLLLWCRLLRVRLLLNNRYMLLFLRFWLFLRSQFLLQFVKLICSYVTTLTRKKLSLLLSLRLSLLLLFLFQLLSCLRKIDGRKLVVVVQNCHEFEYIWSIGWIGNEAQSDQVF